MKAPPLSLYVHLPWCVRKCPYCDFNSHTAGEAPPKARYLAALLRDLEQEAKLAEGRPLESVFLGGGTPSLFSPDEIGVILKGVRALFPLTPNVEITMEANPGTVESGSPLGYRQAGVTRLSIGAQSFDNTMLSRLGRIHDRDDITRSVRDAADAGFQNINIDVMHGLPGQNIEMALADLSAAIDLAPSHISWYQLTLEPNTVFYARPPANLPNEDLAFDMSEKGRQRLADAGFVRYEVSAYAKGDSRSRHNLNYWQFGDYLAVGAGAHGKLTIGSDIYRYKRPSNPLQYMQAGDSAKMMPLSRSDRIFEFMLNVLRLDGGFHESLFEARTGMTVGDLEAATDVARKKDLIRRSKDGNWRPSELGRRFLNDLVAEFIVDAG